MTDLNYGCANKKRERFPYFSTFATPYKATHTHTHTHAHKRPGLPAAAKTMKKYKEIQHMYALGAYLWA